MSRNFYAELPALKTFAEAVDTSLHQDLPDDWLVVITDVLGSTKAIEEGKYKAVNAVGACTIMAVKNVNRDIDVPYVFGGDGATLAIPAEMELGVRRALLGSKKLAQDGFGLDLRIGMVPVKYLKDQGKWVRIVKHQVSANIVQAAITGQGWEYAETLIKDPLTRDTFEVQPKDGIEPDANFEGFECRWQGIPSRKDHKICLLALSTKSDVSEKVAHYKAIIDKISEIYGETDDHHPLHQDLMKLGFSPKALMGEAMIRSKGGILKLWQYLAKMVVQNAVVTQFFKGVDTESVNWSQYKGDLVDNSDYRKFDGMLKMVLDGSKEQEKLITAYFEEQYQSGDLVYGIHTAGEALLTCLIYSHEKEHAHFVDASNGGYAMAAKHLKRRLAEWKALQSPG